LGQPTARLLNSSHADLRSVRQTRNRYSTIMSENAIKPAEDFLRFLGEGRFMIQRSRSSGRYVFYPRVAEPVTGATDLEWVAASGRGTVYAVTVQRERPPTPDINVVLVDLDEGPRLMSRVDGIAPDAVGIGMRVSVRIVREDGDPFVVFVPDAADG
jgi:uncharacterized OB-fold protein